MDEFLNLLSQELSSTIEGLTGHSPSVNSEGEIDASEFPASAAKITIDVSGAASGNINVLVPTELGTALSDLMLGGEGESKESMDDDDLDATKEIISNVFGALQTAMGGQKSLPSLNLSPSSIEFLEDTSGIAGGKNYKFHFALNSIDSPIIFAIDSSIVNAIEGGGASSNEDLSSAIGGVSAPHHSTSSGGGGGSSLQSVLNDGEMTNINMILDVKLSVKVRIGQKKMLLKDVISMDIGSVVELNQLANDPLEILVDDKVIARGEVVIVDGNFGIQITEIGTRRERLEQLQG